MDTLIGETESKDFTGIVPCSAVGDAANVCKDVFVVGKPHPVRPDVFYTWAEYGHTVAEILEGVNERYIDVRLNGSSLPREMWGHVRPKAGTTLEVIAFPQGGDTRKILTITAIVAIMILSHGAASGWGASYLGMGSSFAAGTIGAKALALGVALTGGLMLRALIKPPPLPKLGGGDDNGPPAYGITGIQNQANPFGSVPIVIGDVIYYPPLAADPHIEIQGNEQYARLLFDMGFGTLQLSQFRFGETDITTFEEVDYQIGPDPSLYSNDVNEQPVNVDITAHDSSDERVTQESTDEISVDIVAPGGIYAVDKDQNTLAGEVDFYIEYRPVGGIWPGGMHPAGSWQHVSALPDSQLKLHSGGIVFKNTDNRFTIRGSLRSAIRCSVQWMPGFTGQFEVRVLRTGAPRWRLGGVDGAPVAGGTVANLTYTTLRSVSYSNPSMVETYDGSGIVTTKVAMRILASEKLNGNINTFNCRARQSIPTWNGSTWVNAFTSNPAWIYRWLLTSCPATARPIPTSRVDDAAIIAWAGECETKGFVYNKVVDSETTLGQLLHEVCAAGRATFTVKDGLYSVVRDIQQAAPIQHFTPRNTMGFTGKRGFTDEVHALRCKFVNPSADYQMDERIVYDDGYSADNATKFETMEFPGVTNPDAVWRLARYHLAVGRLRQSEYEWQVDIEHLVCNRGDLIRASHDVVRWGIGAARISQMTGSGAGAVITLDSAPADFVNNGSVQGLSLRFRTQTGASVQSNATTIDGVSYNLLSSAPGINVGDLVLIGVAAGQEFSNQIVTRIEPGADMTATVITVDEAPEVYTADLGPPPEGWGNFVSPISGKKYEEPPDPPMLTINVRLPTGDNPIPEVEVYADYKRNWNNNIQPIG